METQVIRGILDIFKQLGIERLQETSGQILDQDQGVFQAGANHLQFFVAFDAVTTAMEQVEVLLKMRRPL